MRVGILGCALGVLLWFTAHAQQVEFPLDYYSFAEIAQRLSVEGRKVDCARELGQRVAVVRLQPRSWEQARAILESGLDIRLRRISESENRWVLERDPEVMRRERRWRERLAAHIETQRNRDAQLFRQMLDKNVPVDEIVKTYFEEYLPEGAPHGEFPREMLEKQMRQSIEAFRAMPIDLALRDWRAFQRLKARFMEFVLKDTTTVDENDPLGIYRRFAAEHPLSSFGFSQEVLDWARREAEGRGEALKLANDSGVRPTPCPTFRLRSSSSHWRRAPAYSKRSPCGGQL